MIYKYKLNFLISFIAIAVMQIKTAETLKIGYLSSWNIRCGIATYTKNICEALKQTEYLPIVYNNKMSSKEIIEKIKSDNIKILNIQFEPALYDYFDFKKLLKKIKQLKIKIILTVHTEIEEIKKIEKFIDYFIFHKIPKFFSNRKNINIIPIGAPVFKLPKDRNEIRKKYDFSPNDIILTTFGLMAKWKKNSEILKSFVPLLKKNPDYRIQLLTSFSDIDFKQSMKENKKINSVIKNYNLKKQITYITDFLPENELNERLWISDLGYLWCDLNSSGSSAARKQFISARLPLITTNSPHYHDFFFMEYTEQK